jgi:alkylated DNA repair protein alkB homolog 6
MRAGSLPSWLEETLVARILRLPLSEGGEHVFGDSPHRRPNHVLVNEYPPGTGIQPHEDGPAYFPVVVTVSLGGHTVLDIYNKNSAGRREERPKWRVLQERRSLLITSKEIYKECLHGIADIEADKVNEEDISNWSHLRDQTRLTCQTGTIQRELRISATIRDVVVVKDWGKILPGIGGRR